MKKLVGWAVTMVVITTSVYQLALHFGASQEVAAVAVVFAAASATVAPATVDVGAALVAVVVVAALAFAGAEDNGTLAFAAVAAFAAFAAGHDLKYRWVALVLLTEGVTIYAGVFGLLPVLLVGLVALLLLREVDAAK